MFSEQGTQERCLIITYYPSKLLDPEEVQKRKKKRKKVREIKDLANIH